MSALSNTAAVLCALSVLVACGNEGQLAPAGGEAAQLKGAERSSFSWAEEFGGYRTHPLPDFDTRQAKSIKDAFSRPENRPIEYGPPALYPVVSLALPPFTGAFDLVGVSRSGGMLGHPCDLIAVRETGAVNISELDGFNAHVASLEKRMGALDTAVAFLAASSCGEAILDCRCNQLARSKHMRIIQELGDIPGADEGAVEESWAPAIGEPRLKIGSDRVNVEFTFWSCNSGSVIKKIVTIIDGEVVKEGSELLASGVGSYGCFN